MVKKILLVMLLAVPVYGQTSPRVDSISAAVRQQVGASSSYSVLRALNRAYQQVCIDYPAYELCDTVYVDSASGSATLPTGFVEMKSCDLLIGSGGRKPLRPLAMLPQEKIAEKIIADMETNDPTDQDHYSYFGRTLTTYPRWLLADDSAAFEIRYYSTGSYLSANGDTIAVSVKYRNAVFLLTCAEVQAQRGRMTEAAMYRQLCWQEFGAPTKQEVVSQ